MSTEKKYNFWDMITGKPTIDKLEEENANLDLEILQLTQLNRNLESELEGFEAHLDELAVSYTESGRRHSFGQSDPGAQTYHSRVMETHLDHGTRARSNRVQPMD